MLKILIHFIFVLLIIFPLKLWAVSFDISRLDPEGLIPKNLLQKTFDYYDLNINKIKNKKFVGIIDFSVHNSKERFFIVDTDSGLVETYFVSHGKNSDPDFDGFATKFSNTPDSLMSSLGFFLTAETYLGQNGYSLRLDGLEKSNSNARTRAIVIHGASYVSPSKPGDKIGRSYGCPAIELRYHQDIIDRMKDGALLFAGLSKN